MRGKLMFFLFLMRIERITPAHAGKTAWVRNYCSEISDHPRACGENNSWNCADNSRNGSPPRMRGKHSLYKSTKFATRITPAHAGKTTPNIQLERVTTDHPRACGENPYDTKVLDCSGGSPPRMRGKPNILRSRIACQRITPAHAGKTAALRFLSLRTSDHPRACGEN